MIFQTKSAAATLFLASALSLSLTAFAADDPVVATVNGVELHQSDVAAYRSQFPATIPNMTEDQVTAKIIDQLTLVKALAQSAEKSGLTKDARYKKLLGLRTDELGANLYVKQLEEQKVTDKAVRDLYDQTVAPTKPQDEFKARHILVENEDDAKEIVKQIKGGKDFAAIAKEKSKDPGSAANGGDLGWFTLDVMVPEFGKAVAALKNNEVSAPVHSQFGWHVIQTIDRRKQMPPKFEDVRENLAQQLRKKVNEEAIEAVRKSAKIELKGKAAAPKLAPAQ